MIKILIILFATIFISNSFIYSQQLVSREQSKVVMNKLLPIFFRVFPEWENATVSETPIKFNDLYGQPFIYLYEIKTPENLAGYCVISAYDDLPYLNEASAANNPIANFTQCKNLFFHYLKMNEQPSLLKYEFISTGLGLFYIKLT